MLRDCSVNFGMMIDGSFIKPHMIGYLIEHRIILSRREGKTAILRSVGKFFFVCSEEVKPYFYSVFGKSGFANVL